MTTEPETKEAAEAELRAAEASVAAFDGGTLVHEDGSPNPLAAAREAFAKFA